jgi:hypothetical protein|tara:strand:- start:298 stop:477 length:180 start_codon:yes stop_codon:yes gene_type:complete
MSADNLEKALGLLNQIIEKSKMDDKVESSKNPEIALGGDGWITHNLKLVRTLLTEGRDS